MDIYTDYENWKIENYDLIKGLIKQKSTVISRFSHVIGVVEHLYLKYKDTKQELNRDEELIFDTGFNYIHDHFCTISLLLESTFKNDTYAMNKLAKTINLLLYVNDFQNDILNHENISSKDIEPLDDFEAKVLKYLEDKKQVPDTMFPILDDITTTIYEKNNIEYYGVNDIMYDIALEYDLVDKSDDSISFFTAYLENKISFEESKKA